MAGMNSSFREISKTIAYILLFVIIAFRLYQGDSIITSIAWGGIVFLIFNIISILFSNIMIKILHDYELKRMLEMAAAEEEAEDDDDELYEREE